MRRIAAVLSVLSVFILVSCATGPTADRSLVDRGIAALGGADALSALKTVYVKGTVQQWEPEQSDVPGGEMRFANESTFETFVDRSKLATRTDWVKNFAYPAPRTFTFSEIVTPEAGYVIGVDSNGRNAENLKASPPAHSMSGLRLATSQRELMRISPGALLLQMKANLDAVTPVADVMAGGKTYPALGYGGFIVGFDPQTALPAVIRTLDYDPVWGDVTYDYLPADWQAASGVQVARSFKYQFRGSTLAEGKLTDVRINGPIDGARLEIPAAVRASAAKPATGNVPHQWVIRRQFIGTYLDSDNVSYDTKGSQGLRLQQVAPGVDHVVGGSHNSLLVEMGNHLIVFDAPVSDSQSLWVVNAAKAKYPGKPIRYVVLTHHHMDHTGGVRGFVAEGATLVVGQGAGAHWRRVLSAPWSRNPDLQARDLSNAPIVEVTDRYVLSDAKREVHAYLMDSPHAKGSLLGYVPDAKLGFVTDIWTPGPPLPAKPNPGLLSVVSAVKKANIQPERFAGGHGTTADYASLTRLAGQ